VLASIGEAELACLMGGSTARAGRHLNTVIGNSLRNPVLVTHAEATSIYPNPIARLHIGFDWTFCTWKWVPNRPRNRCLPAQASSGTRFFLPKMQVFPIGRWGVREHTRHAFREERMRYWRNL